MDIVRLTQEYKYKYPT